ncbi:hypothetical protein HK100_010367, partial [Physocladia obscura]
QTSESGGGGPGENDDSQHEGAAHAQGPPGQDLRDALGVRQAAPGVGVAGRQADSVGHVHDQQDARDTAAVVVGDDVCVRAVGQLRGMRRAGQPVLGVQPQGGGGGQGEGGGQGGARAERAHGLPVVLPLPVGPADRDGVGRHELHAVGRGRGRQDARVHGPHGRRHVAVARARQERVRVGRLRRHGQGVGRAHGPLRADVRRPRVRHQRRVLLPRRRRLRVRLRRRLVPPLRPARRPRADGLHARQHP